jgi:hypothetical protein
VRLTRDEISRPLTVHGFSYFFTLPMERRRQRIDQRKRPETDFHGRAQPRAGWPASPSITRLEAELWELARFARNAGSSAGSRSDCRTQAALRIRRPRASRGVAVTATTIGSSCSLTRRTSRPATGRRANRPRNRLSTATRIRVVVRDAPIAAPPPEPVRWRRKRLRGSHSSCFVGASATAVRRRRCRTVLSTGVLVLVRWSLRGGAPVPSDIRHVFGVETNPRDRVSTRGCSIPIVASGSRTPFRRRHPPREPALPTNQRSRNDQGRKPLVMRGHPRPLLPTHIQADANADPNARADPTPTPTPAPAPAPAAPVHGSDDALPALIPRRHRLQPPCHRTTRRWFRRSSISTAGRIAPGRERCRRIVALSKRPLARACDSDSWNPSGSSLPLPH